MKAQHQIIGGRYQYTPLAPLRQNPLYSQYKVYDRVTKRDLLMHLLPRDDRVVQLLRDVKHPFVVLVFDVVMLDDGNVAFLYQSGAITTLSQVLEGNGYLMEEDTLVVAKMLLLSLRQLHEKTIVFGRLCSDNVVMWHSALIKLGYYVYEDQMELSWQSPQMVEGKRLTPASDIYSLGVILYKMLYGVLPFEGLTEKELLKKVKGKNYNQSYREAHSPFGIVVSKQVSHLVESMLSFNPEKRPSIQQILNCGFMSFHVDTELQAYTKPKTNLLPEPFIKKYLLYRASKMIHKYDAYYQESSYMALSTQDKKMVRVYSPEIRMFEAEPRKVESFYEKLRAIQQNYNEECQMIVKLEDVDRFRQEPVFVAQYCNQGDLLTYLQRRNDREGWLKEKEINLLMYIIAIAIKQIRELGVTSIHTINSQRIMVKDKGIKLREPGLLTPSVQKRLLEGRGQIDYFAPELKQNQEMVQLDKSDMWSFGVLYYYLLSQKLPLSDEEGLIDIHSLNTHQKNRNIIGRCLDYSVETRLELQNVKLQGVDEELLQLMLKEKKQQQQVKELAQMRSEEEEPDEQALMRDRKVMFKNRKKPIFKDYNKILTQSSTSSCRICIKAVLGVITLIAVFFGLFLINGGYGLIRSYYFNPITLQVPFNYGTSLVDMTILTTNGGYIQDNYSQYSYEQFTQALRCATNQYTSESPGLVSEFINGSNSAFCLFGYVWLTMFIILYFLYQFKLDLPTVLWERQDKKDNKNLWHFISFIPLIPSILFCFFYTFAIHYTMQVSPCFGIEDLAYPKFTSTEALLSGDTGSFFTKVFLTVILWAFLMMLYGYLSLIAKRVNIRVYEWKVIIPLVIIMVIYTLICRVGFGSSTPLQPTWTYKINTDLALSKHYGFFGFFPEALLLAIFVGDRLVDLIFWYCLKRGLEGKGEEDIQQVKIVQARYQPTEEKKLEQQKSNIYMIEHDFERFD